MFLEDRISLCSLEWPQIYYYPPTSAFQVLRVQQWIFHTVYWDTSEWKQILKQIQYILNIHLL